VQSVKTPDWSRPFDEPIVLPDGGELRTLLDAGRYVDALPRSMHEREEWQTVMEVLLSAVEGREPVSLLRIALTLALPALTPGTFFLTIPDCCHQSTAPPLG
jgi:hypothetical protein